MWSHPLAPDLQSPSQPQSVTALVPSYTAWWHSAWAESSVVILYMYTLYIMLFTLTQPIVFQYVVVKDVVKISIWCWCVISRLHQQSLWRHDNAVNDACHSDASTFPPLPKYRVINSSPYFAQSIVWMTPKTKPSNFREIWRLVSEKIFETETNFFAPPPFTGGAKILLLSTQRPPTA